MAIGLLNVVVVCMSGHQVSDCWHSSYVSPMLTQLVCISASGISDVASWLGVAAIGFLAVLSGVTPEVVQSSGLNLDCLVWGDV